MIHFLRLRSNKKALFLIQDFSIYHRKQHIAFAAGIYKILALDMGFEYENLAHVDLSGVPHDKREALVSELRNLGCVESVASALQHPIDPVSGNNVWLGDDYTVQVNVADMYRTNPDFFATAGIKLDRKSVV